MIPCLSLKINVLGFFFKTTEARDYHEYSLQRQNLSSVTNESFCNKLVKVLLLIGYQQICHWFLSFVIEKRLCETDCLRNKFNRKKMIPVRFNQFKSNPDGSVVNLEVVWRFWNKFPDSKPNGVSLIRHCPQLLDLLEWDLLSKGHMVVYLQECTCFLRSDV